MSGLMACGGASEDRQETVETVLSDEEVAVTVIPLAEVDFQHELISNGKLAAKRRVDLRFESQELIAHIYVKNGDRVRKGMKLAEQDAFKLKNQVDQALDALEKAKLEMQDVLRGVLGRISAYQVIGQFFYDLSGTNHVEQHLWLAVG